MLLKAVLLINATIKRGGIQFVKTLYVITPALKKQLQISVFLTGYFALVFLTVNLKSYSHQMFLRINKSRGHLPDKYSYCRCIKFEFKTCYQLFKFVNPNCLTKIDFDLPNFFVLNLEMRDQFESIF